MKNLILLFSLFIAFSSCAQVNFIKQAKAFYYLRIPGIIPVDEKQNPIERKTDTVTTIYVEVKGKMPEWKKAWYAGRMFTLTPTVFKDSNIVVGKKLNSDEKVFFRRAKGNGLIALELYSEKAQAPPKKINNGEILLQGVVNGKIFYYTVKKPVEISSPEFM